jgi:hypothetical protein
MWSNSKELLLESIDPSLYIYIYIGHIYENGIFMRIVRLFINSLIKNKWSRLRTYMCLPILSILLNPLLFIFSNPFSFFPLHCLSCLHLTHSPPFMLTLIFTTINRGKFEWLQIGKSASISFKLL